MTVRMTEIVMRVPLAGGRFCIIIFDPTIAPDFAPIHALNSARMAHQSAPLFLKPLKENGAGAPLLHSAPLPSHEWRNSSPSGKFLGLTGTVQKTPRLPQEELADARSAVAFKASKMADLDEELIPAWHQESEVRQAILSTHHRDGRVVRLSMNGARDRTGLFAELDAISREWGPTRSERKNLQAEIKALEKLIVGLEKAIAKENQRKAKHAKRS